MQKPRYDVHAVVAEWLRRSIRNRLGVPAQVRILSTAHHTFYPTILRKSSAARSLLTTTGQSFLRGRTRWAATPFDQRPFDPTPSVMQAPTLRLGLTIRAFYTV